MQSQPVCDAARREPSEWNSRSIAYLPACLPRHTHTHTHIPYTLEPLPRVEICLDVRCALDGDCIDGMQWHDAILLVKELRFIEMR